MSDLTLKHNRDGTLWMHASLGSFVLTREQIIKFRGLKKRKALAMRHFSALANSQKPKDVNWFWFLVVAMFFIAGVATVAGGTA